jgi:hypothetical protein
MEWKMSDELPIIYNKVTFMWLRPINITIDNVGSFIVMPGCRFDLYDKHNYQGQPQQFSGLLMVTNYTGSASFVADDCTDQG